MSTSRPWIGLLLLGVACGSDPAPGSDAGPDAGSPDTGSPTDGGGGDAAVGDRVVLHYHRADGDYAGVKARVSGDVTANALDPTGTDGFGAIFEVPLSSGAAAIAYAFEKGGALDPAAALSVELSSLTSARAVWHFSGYDVPLVEPPPAIPGENQVAIYYKRKDASYDGWGLHLWGDVAEPTLWSIPAPSVGVDPRFGAYWLVDTKPGAARVNLIVHMGDTKDPGPDMGFDLAELGNIVFLVTKSTDVAPHPVEIPEFAIEGAKAHFLTRGGLAWSFDDRPATRFELRASKAADIEVEGVDVVGGQAIELTLDPAGLSAELKAKWPHLASKQWLTLPRTATVAELVKSQLVVVARDDQGTALAATKVQLPGVLDDLYAYDGPLGVTFAGRVPTIRVWAPTARSVKLVRFGADLRELEALPMTREARGVHTIVGEASWYETYYQYEVEVFHPITNRVETLRVTDPYSVSTSADGTHTQIFDLDDPASEPAGWDAVTKPALDAPEDLAIWELHVRDFSAFDEDVAPEHRGRFLGFTYDGTGGRPESLGVRHLKALAGAGVRLVHLLPAFDFATVREDRSARVELTDPFASLCAKNAMVPAADCTSYAGVTIAEALAGLDPSGAEAQRIVGYLRSLDGYNWGYDPQHYTVPEGSYATAPTGPARIKEFREMVKALAGYGLRVALDVVYNHTNSSGVGEKSVLDKIVPGYYHRLNVDTGFVEASTCCANTATEHAMMERLMIDSALTWARAYKVDAFRFDLMGHHLKRNMLAVKSALAALTPATDGVDGAKIYLYGEGWDFGEVANNARGTNASQINLAGTGIGSFNDRIRDAIRGGGPFDSQKDLVKNQGFSNGLFVDPNAEATADDTTKSKLLELADHLKIGLAGNLKSFKIVTRAGGVTTGGLVGYNGAPTGYVDDPEETINYSEAHDNQTLFDINAYKVKAGTSIDDRVRIQNLGTSLVALAQGVPFFHAGQELLRSKSMERDSYDAGDWFNRFDFTRTTNNWKVGLPREDANGTNWDIIRAVFGDTSIAPTRSSIDRAFDHFVEVLTIRRSSPLFRLRTGDDVKKRVDFHNVGPNQVPGVLAMTISDGPCAGVDLDPSHDGAIVVFNARPAAVTLDVPGANGATLHPVLSASTDPLVRTARATGASIEVPARTTAVFLLPQAGAPGGDLACNTR